MDSERAPYGRRDRRGDDLNAPASDGRMARRKRDTSFEGAIRRYEGQTYYGLPALKSSHYGWLVITYFFVGGIASAAQFLATIVDLFGQRQDRTIVRWGRYLALLGSLASPVLLILDLHTPQRFYNMLRIYRRTSPMSIGSWALMLFGTLSGLTASAQMLHDLTGARIFQTLARLSAVPAALAGGMVSLYTGTLLAATSTPLWSSAFPFLSSLFGSSAASTASAALSLIALVADTPKQTRLRLERFGFIAGSTELLFALIILRRWQRAGVTQPLTKPPLSLLYRFGALGLGMIVPAAIHSWQFASGKHSRSLSALAALATLAGGYCLRATMILAGNISAHRPEDYFENTQSDRNPQQPAGSAEAAGSERSRP